MKFTSISLCILGLCIKSNANEIINDGIDTDWAGSFSSQVSTGGGGQASIGQIRNPFEYGIPKEKGDLNIRFSKIPLISVLNRDTRLEPARDPDRDEYPMMEPKHFPVEIDFADRWLRKTGAISVFHPKDCVKCPIHPPELVRAAVVNCTQPNKDPNHQFWKELYEVVEVNIARIGQDPDPERLKSTYWMKVPEIWRGQDMKQIAENVHDEYPGSIHEEEIKRLFKGPLDFNRKWKKNCPDCIRIDRRIIPSKSSAEFIRGMVMIADLNTWAFGTIGPMSFATKWYCGRPRPEEMVWKIVKGHLGVSDGVPVDLHDKIMTYFGSITRMQEFTQYGEGSPDHPSWPAMHSASSAASLWMKIVFKLNKRQWCDVKAIDYAISYARTFAGVHYSGDNIAGLNLGQHILARILPKHLHNKYGSDINLVKKKIKNSRFDWMDYLDSECF